MPKAISNTAPLLYLYRIGVVEWLPELFDIDFRTSGRLKSAHKAFIRQMVAEHIIRRPCLLLA